MDLEELFSEAARLSGINIKNAEKFFLFKDILLHWNQKINLTAITDETDIILKHFVDSLMLTRFVDFANAGQVIDVGAGAGFPSIPLAILNPLVSFTLIDSVNKKVSFIEKVKKELDLPNITCCHIRAEDAGHRATFREQFDICVARAVASLPSLLEYCLPFVKVTGALAAMKGPNISEELSMSQKAVDTLGGSVESICRYQIPFTDITHSVIVVKKTVQLSVKYPRNAAQISKHPIR